MRFSQICERKMAIFALIRIFSPHFAGAAEWRSPGARKATELAAARGRSSSPYGAAGCQSAQKKVGIKPPFMGKEVLGFLGLFWGNLGEFWPEILRYFGEKHPLFIRSSARRYYRDRLTGLNS